MINHHTRKKEIMKKANVINNIEELYSELKNNNRVWFTEGALNYLRNVLPSVTTTELDKLYSVIAKEMDFTVTIAVRKLCRLITDGYLPIYLVDRLRKQFNFVKKHEKVEGKEDNLFPLIAVSLSEENRDCYGNLILAFDKFYKDKLGVEVGVLNLLDAIETENKTIVATSFKQNNPNQDWKTVEQSAQLNQLFINKMMKMIYEEK